MRCARLLRWAFLAALAGAAHAADHGVARIVAPGDGATLHDNRGRIAVVVAVEPALRAAAGERVELLLDGQVAASEARGRLALTGVERGTHTLVARVTAPDGTVRAVSPPVTFHLWHASRLFPGREK
jgi:hypothetical protein